MPLSEFYPYPPRPGMNDVFAESDFTVPGDVLAPEALGEVQAFEKSLYDRELDASHFPNANTYLEAQAEVGQPVPPFETIWLKKIKSTTFGVHYFLTDEGRQLLTETTGHELQAQTVDQACHELSGLTIATVSSSVLGKLEAASVGYEEGCATDAFIAGGFSGEAVAEPAFLQLYKNPALILEKAIGYRQLKQYFTNVLRDLRAGAAGDQQSTTDAMILITQLYRRRINTFIANNYIDAYKFAYQAQVSGDETHQALLRQLHTTLPVFYAGTDAGQSAEFLVRMDRYRNGISRDAHGRFTWLSQAATSKALQASERGEPAPVDRGMYTDVDPEALRSTTISSQAFKSLLSGVVETYDLLSVHEEWDSDREGPAPDEKWQIIVDARFKSLKVEDKQRIVQVPDKETTLSYAVEVGSHELTHIIQHHNKRLIGSLAIMKRIGLDSASEQTEVGGKWREKQAREVITGKTDTRISGIGYLKALGAKAEGRPFGHVVQACYEALLDSEPELTPDRVAARAVNRARRAYRSGGFEYARELPLLTNSQPLSYLEQALIYENLPDEQRRLLLVGGVSIANLVQLSSVGLVDLSQLFIPTMPWELMYPTVKELLLTA